MAVPKQTDPQFKLRLTPEVKAKIERAANESGRSMNAKILRRLEESFAERPASDYDTADYVIDRVINALIQAGWTPPSSPKPHE